MDAEPLHLASLVRHGAETPADVKDEAFRLWVQNGRSWKRTSDLTGIGVSTLRLWSGRDDWEQRRRDQSAAFLPGMRVETAVSLQMAAHHAAIRLQQIAWEAAELGVPPNVKEVQSLTLIVDRAGHAPSKPEPSITASRPALPTLTPDERRALSDRISGNNDS